MPKSTQGNASIYPKPHAEPGKGSVPPVGKVPGTGKVNAFSTQGGKGGKK